MKSERILFVGQTVPGSRTLQRIRAMRELEYVVDVISTNLPGATYETRPNFRDRVQYRLRLPVDRADANGHILEKIKSTQFHIIWLERAVEIRRNTLHHIKQLSPAAKIVWYAEDDMMNPVHMSRWVENSLDLFDLWVTTKSQNARPEELTAKGVKNILFVNNSFDPEVHRPVELSPEDQNLYASDVCFVGTYEEPRAKTLLRLAQNKLNIRIWGNGWAALADRYPNIRIEGRAAYDQEYGKIVSASKINLCFLRKGNRDLQTCRSVELPAMAGFMAHERNDEICNILKENVEAVYFNSSDECVSLCRRYLSDDALRNKIALAGQEKIIAGGFRHHDRIETILNAAIDP